MHQLGSCLTARPGAFAGLLRDAVSCFCCSQATYAVHCQAAKSVWTVLLHDPVVYWGSAQGTSTVRPGRVLLVPLSQDDTAWQLKSSCCSVLSFAHPSYVQELCSGSLQS